MHRAASLLLSTLVHLAYFAFLVQAFAIPPPAEYFQPCACTPSMPKVQTRVVVIGNLRPLQPNSLYLLSHTTKTDNQFCTKSKASDSLLIGSNLRLGPRLENLIAEQSEPVRVCMTLNNIGKVASVYTRSNDLGLADERLISDFIADNWSFGSAQHSSKNLAGNYALTVEVR